MSEDKIIEYDFVVIGGGSAGYAAAREAVDNGLKVAVIDGSKKLGGLCILRGCMPSKALIEVGNRYEIIKNSSDYGLNIEGHSFDWDKIFDRKESVINEFAKYRQDQLTDGKFDLIRAKARFLDENSVKLNYINDDEGSKNYLVRFKTCLISTGSVNFVPNIKGISDVNPVGSDEVLAGEVRPSSIIILGGGPIALEMAHFYNCLGVKVSIVQRSDQFLRGEDKDVSKVISDAFIEKGMNVFLGTKILEMSLIKNGKDEEKKIIFEHNGDLKEVIADEILVAFGRSPNTKNLELNSGGIEIGKGDRIKSNKFMQTNKSHIFSAGDVTGPFDIVHVAIEQGEIAAKNAAKFLKGESNRLEEIDYRLRLFGVFSEPQFARVGLNEADCQKEGIEYESAKYPFDDHGKSIIMNEKHGFVKLIVEKDSRKIIGGSIVGPHASELIHEISVAMKFNATAEDLLKTPHYHPTLSEIWTYPAEDLI